ncbi:hypothetical protein [Pedobacter mucosus]|uniref:hypothetical protein n=1 Tax=Pedobacter mucosus TaxID=2895286 RepID=UPI001EE45E98|nr:hypothetical protein [Pedobacter mucosus]UKT63027.1 hypothetical protein LOK61_14770 [Pedobacter mucosus]
MQEAFSLIIQVLIIVVFISFKNGDNESFFKLYHDYALAIFGILTRTITDHDLAKECFTQSFYKIWSERRSYDPEKEHLFTWIVKIARSCAQSGPFAQKDQLDNNILEDIDLIFGANIRTYLHRLYHAEGKNFGTCLDITIKQAINLIYFESQYFNVTAEKFGMYMDGFKRKTIQSIRKLKIATKIDCS